MGKDPAFLFYPNDYIGGTMGMTFEEKGAYIELLMLQFNRGHMTSQMIGQTVGQLWVKLEDKFKIDAEGLYFNERLDLEIDKRKTFVQSRFNNLSGKNQYTKKEGHTEGHMTKHMENEDVNEDKIDKGAKFQKPTLEEVKAYCYERQNDVDCGKWYDFYESKGWMIGKNKMKDWKAAVRTWEKSKEENVPKFNSGPGR